MGLSMAVYYGLGWLKPLLGNAAGWVIAAGLGVIYVALLAVASRYPDLEMDDPEAPTMVMPQTRPTLMTGLHYILPVVVLVWCLMVERLSPGLSAFWATLLMMVIIVTQKPLLALFRHQDDILASARRGLTDLGEGLVTGARNMTGIGVATAAAGIIVGAVSQTGVGLVFADLIEMLSLGNLMLMLIWTAVLCVILGMGLPTTANYIVVSILLAPVLVTLGQQNGLIVPLIAIHMFVFYFGLRPIPPLPFGRRTLLAWPFAWAAPFVAGWRPSTSVCATTIFPSCSFCIPTV